MNILPNHAWLLTQPSFAHAFNYCCEIRILWHTFKTKNKVLANCAGFAIAKEFDEMEMADFERIFRVNTLGSAYVTRALLPGMKAAGGGRVLFTSSMAGQVCVHLSLSLFRNSQSLIVARIITMACWRILPCMCVYLAFFHTPLSVFLSVCDSVCVSVCVSLCLSVSPPPLPLSPSVFLAYGLLSSSTCARWRHVSVCLSICRPVSLSPPPPLSLFASVPCSREATVTPRTARRSSLWWAWHNPCRWRWVYQKCVG